MKQISSPEEFLIGKTIKSTHKALGPTDYKEGQFALTYQTISFIFTDDTFALFHCTEQGLVFSKNIEIDVEKYAVQNADGTERKNSGGGLHRHRNAQLAKYAHFLFELGLVKEEVYTKYRNISRIEELENNIKAFDYHHEIYKREVEELKELNKNITQ